MRRIRASFFRILMTATMIVLLAVVLGVACQDTEEGVSTPTSDPGTELPAMTDEGVPGVTDSRILFGQSAAFSGPAQQLGNDMSMGIQAAFHERNQSGGGARASIGTDDPG